ncbi:MAG TPA: hypothetical protein VHG34_01565 [Nitrososphaeraceae archaeon]|nr:hypothetical protein [Nitrososphaeraceae archaeon]
MLLDNVFPNTAELGVVAELLIHQKWSKVKKELCLVSALNEQHLNFQNTLTFKM